MPFDSYDQALDRAAEQCGIETRFWDIFGREHTASSEVKSAIVKAFGIRTDSAEAIETSLKERETSAWTRILPPAIVGIWEKGTVIIPVTLPETELRSNASVLILLENGKELTRSVDFSTAHIEERWPFDPSWVRVKLDTQIEVPLGYHRIEIRTASRTASARLIAAPKSAWQPDELRGNAKIAGLVVALYGLRSARNWGFGDFTDLKRLAKWAFDNLGVSFIALNPLHCIQNRRPYNTSPYLPSTIFFQNLLYVDVEAVPEWSTCRRARECFASRRIQSELHLLREAPEVEYERVQRLKVQFLKLLFTDFLRNHWRKDSARAREFREFQTEAGELLSRFGLFCALDEHLHAKNPDLWIWTEWPKEYQDPESPQVQAFARKHWRSVLFYQYAAWEAAKQLEQAQQFAVKAGLKIGLYHDLALATDRFGADIWAHRDFYAPGCRVGSPPDDFSPQGQDWGFPAPNTLRHGADGYQLFRESIRRTCQYGGALRIDHVMRFFRLYWIPDGMNATQGAYVKERARDLVGIVALESVRNRVLLVGEDLGTVEPYIREMLAEAGILSYRLFYFERHQDGSYRLPEEYPRQALVSSTTHDLPTLSGFWTGSDIGARRKAGVLDENGHRAQWVDRDRDKQRMLDALWRAGLMPPDYARDAKQVPELDTVLHDAIIAFLAITPSMLMLVNEEDLTLETQQQNLPGTTSQYPNWGRKMRFTLEHLDHDPGAHELTRRMRQQLAAAGRV